MIVKTRVCEYFFLNKPNCIIIFTNFHIHMSGGGWMICHFSIIRAHFGFCELNFIVLFKIRENYDTVWFI